jgi:TonB family protein
MVVRNIALTDAQAAQLETIFLQHQPQLASLRDDLLKQEQQLRALLEADRIDERAASAQMKMVAAARLNLETENNDMTLGMRRVLIADQWRKLEKLWNGVSTTSAPQPEKASYRDPQSGEIVYDLKSTPGIIEPAAISTPRPKYTPEARTAKIGGTIVLEATIGTDGIARGLKILQGLGYGLDEAAIETIETSWRFKPALLNGQPVNVRVNIEVTMRLY